MLSLQLKSGDYLTIGENVVVQAFGLSGGFVRLAIKAPREVPILRGEVLERTEQRPGGLYDRRPKSPSERARKAKDFDRMAAKKEYFTARRASIAQELNGLGEQLEEGWDDPEQLKEVRCRLAELAQTIRDESAV